MYCDLDEYLEGVNNIKNLLSTIKGDIIQVRIVFGKKNNAERQVCTTPLSQPLSQVHQQSARYRPGKHQVDLCHYNFK